MAKAVLTGAALAAALAAAAGCGSGKDHRSFGDYTDCSTIGRLTTVHDPARDQAGRLAGVPEEPQGDLVALSIARARGRLCVEYRARGPVKPAVAYLLILRPLARETPAVQLEATVFAAEQPKALLNPGAKGDTFHAIPAKVGIRGDRLSVLVERGAFARLGAAAEFDAFRFQARSAVVTKDGGHLTDCAPSC